MERENVVEFKVSGKYALFSDPINKMGGEKFTYQIPTYQALKGILEGIYWKPTLIWVIDDVRVMKPIRTQSQGIRPINYSGGNTLSLYTYLVDVEYQVKAHFIWNMNREDLIEDRNENKHYQIATRMIERGGRRDIFLGTRECQGYVEPVKFGEGKGVYDEYGELSFGIMFHGFDYPDEAYDDMGKDKLVARLWAPVMKNGYVRFIRPDECSIRRVVKEMYTKSFKKCINFIGLDEFESEGEILELD